MRKSLKYTCVAVVISTCYLVTGLIFGFVHPLNMCDKHNIFFSNKPCHECKCMIHEDCYPIKEDK